MPRSLQERKQPMFKCTTELPLQQSGSSIHCSPVQLPRSWYREASNPNRNPSTLRLSLTPIGNTCPTSVTDAYKW